MFIDQMLSALLLCAILQISFTLTTTQNAEEDFDDIASVQFVPVTELGETEFQDPEDGHTAVRSSDAFVGRRGWLWSRKITVTIKLDWDSCVHKPKPPPFTVRVKKGTNLARILEMAADKIKCYRFSTRYFPKPLGHYLTSICDIRENKELNYFWLIYDSSGKLTPTGIDNFKPKNHATITFRYQFVKHHS